MIVVSKEMRLNVVLFLFTCFCYFYVIPVYTAAMALRNDFGPQMFPRVAIAVTGISALGLIIKELLKKKADSEKKEENKRGNALKYLQSFLYVFLYVLFVSFIGFYCSSFMLAAIYFRKMPRKNYFTNLVIVIILFALIWLMFEKMMKVSLPAGLLF